MTKRKFMVFDYGNNCLTGFFPNNNKHLFNNLNLSRNVELTIVDCAECSATARVRTCECVTLQCGLHEIRNPPPLNIELSKK